MAAFPNQGVSFLLRVLWAGFAGPPPAGSSGLFLPVDFMCPGATQNSLFHEVLSGGFVLPDLRPQVHSLGEEGTSRRKRDGKGQEGRRRKKARKEICLHAKRRGKEIFPQIHPWQGDIGCVVVLQPEVMLDWKMEQKRGGKVQ